jgi:ABC-type polysaccharide/polyol phosphate transport system ATPase subunit
MGDASFWSPVIAAPTKPTDGSGGSTQKGADTKPLRVSGVDMTFVLPGERPRTLKERILHPKSAGHGALHALKDVTFEVERGEFFGIVGRNGSGKSTLLKCLAGIYRTDRGTIEIDGRMATFIELGVGFNPDLNARDNVLLNATLLGLSPAEAESRLDHIIEFAELEQFTELKLRNYSSGMYVRLAFAVAINVDADILFIDEVLAVGDLAFQQKCFDTFHEIKESGKTVIFVSHAMDLMKRFCDRAMLLEQGAVTAIGNPSEVALRYEQTNLEHVQELAADSSGGSGQDGSAASSSGTGMRVGDGTVRITDSWMENDSGERVTKVDQGDHIHVGFEVEFISTLDQPIFGIALHDDDHRSIFATNTEEDKIATGRFSAGSRATYSVRFLNELERGLYYISIAVAHRGGSRRAEYVERALSIQSVGDRTPNGVVNLPHESSLATALDPA